MYKKTKNRCINEQVFVNVEKTDVSFLERKILFIFSAMKLFQTKMQAILVNFFHSKSFVISMKTTLGLKTEAGELFLDKSPILWIFLSLRIVNKKDDAL